MLIYGVLLLILGGVVAYLGRSREQWLFLAGVIIFFVGLVLIAIWLIDMSGADTTAALLYSTKGP